MAVLETAWEQCLSSRPSPPLHSPHSSLVRKGLQEPPSFRPGSCISPLGGSLLWRQDMEVFITSRCNKNSVPSPSSAHQIFPSTFTSFCSWRCTKSGVKRPPPLMPEDKTKEPPKDQYLHSQAKNVNVMSPWHQGQVNQRPLWTCLPNQGWATGEWQLVEQTHGG